MEVLQQHVSGGVPELMPELARCQALLDGLMAKDRNNRFASAQALLENILGVAA
jgi:hypothetical protein